MKYLMIAVIVGLTGCAGNQSALDKANEKIQKLEKQASDDSSYEITCKEAVAKVRDLSTEAKESATNAAHKVSEAATNAYDSAKEWAKKEYNERTGK